jgi:hypothetical protein
LSYTIFIPSFFDHSRARGSALRGYSASTPTSEARFDFYSVTSMAFVAS